MDQGPHARRFRGSIASYRGGMLAAGWTNVVTGKRGDARDAGGAKAPRRLLLPLAAGHCSWRHLVAGIRGELGPSARNGPRILEREPHSWPRNCSPFRRKRRRS